MRDQMMLADMPRASVVPDHPAPYRRFIPQPLDRRSLTAASLAALGLHLALLLALLVVLPRAQPAPDAMTAIELMPMPDAAKPVPPAPDLPIAENTPSPARSEPPPPQQKAATQAPAAPPVPAPEAAAPSVAPQTAHPTAPATQVPAELRLAEATPNKPAATPSPVPAANLPPPPVPAAPAPRPPRPAPRPARVPPPRRDVAHGADDAAPSSSQAKPAPRPATMASVVAPGAVAGAPPDAIPAWRAKLRERLRQAQRYPAAAGGIEGVAEVQFTLNRAGHVLAVALLQSTGSPVLDTEAVAMIYRARPLPPVPEAAMRGPTMTLSIPVTFTVQ